MTKELDFKKGVAEIEKLVRELEQVADPNIRSRAVDLVQRVMSMHGAVIERMLEIIGRTGAAGQDIVTRLTQDPMTAGLLLLYDLHPVPLQERVNQALEKVRPYLKSHGGNVEQLSVDDGWVRLRMQGSCHGCPSSAMTLKLAIEEALYEAAPDMVGLEVEGVVQEAVKQSPAGFMPLPIVQLGNAQPRAVSDSAWEAVPGVELLAQGGVRTIEVGDRGVLFCRLGESFYAYACDCPGCGQSLGEPELSQTALGCPTCGLSYDVMRAGRCTDRPQLHLEPFPLLLENGSVRVALPALR